MGLTLSVPFEAQAKFHRGRLRPAESVVEFYNKEQGL